MRVGVAIFWGRIGFITLVTYRPGVYLHAPRYATPHAKPCWHLAANPLSLPACCPAHRYRFRRFRNNNKTEPLLTAKAGLSLGSQQWQQQPQQEPAALVQASSLPSGSSTDAPKAADADTEAALPSRSTANATTQEAPASQGGSNVSPTKTSETQTPGQSEPPTGPDTTAALVPTAGELTHVTALETKAELEDAIAPLPLPPAGARLGPYADGTGKYTPFRSLAVQPSCISLTFSAETSQTQQGQLKQRQQLEARSTLSSGQHLSRASSWFPVPLTSAASKLTRATSSALLATTRTITKLVPAPKPTSALAHVDRSLPLLSQLGIVLWVAMFVLYPSWVQITLGIFACYVIDDGKGPYAEHQQVGGGSGREAGTGCSCGGVPQCCYLHPMVRQLTYQRPGQCRQLMRCQT